MDFTPSSAQQMLVSTAREFLRRHCPPERVQAWALDERGFDEKLWCQMAELGWPGLLVSPELGGSGRKLFVKDAHVADVLAVVVRESESLGLVLMPADRRGISRIQLAAISGEKMFEVVFDDVEVTAADRLGAAGHGGALLTPALEA